MKLSAKSKLLHLFTLAAGLLGLILRMVLYTTGIDEKGLIIPGHWAQTGLWAITGLTLLTLALLTWKLEGPDKYRDCFRQSPVAAGGSFAAALMLVITAVADLLSRTGSALDSGLTLAGGLCLVALGISRLWGRKPNFLFPVVLCLAFALRMVLLYRQWSSDPQVMDYCFYMGAYIALMLTAYEQAAFCCGMGSHRKLWLFSLLGVYLCLVSAWHSPAPALLPACGLWCLTNLTSLETPRRRKMPQWEETP